jgi:hypothetical protein
MTAIFIDQAIDELQRNFRGELIRPEMPEYDEARRVRNGLIDRCPAFIARCSGVADVVAAVDFAREHDLLLSIRGGGHNVSGAATNDGGVVIDLSAMRGVRVDPAMGTVRVQGGATWGDVDRETQLFGLAVHGGVVSTTGIGGLTIHGGYGHLRRKHGLSLDSLISVEIVTADGQVRTASATENPDLFWAVRGAGSNFGVITSFEFQLHPISPLLFLAAPAYPLEDAERVVAAWRDFVADAPDEISSVLLQWSIPAVDFFPPELHHRQVVIPVAVQCGPAEEGERALMPLRELGTPLLDLSHATPYADLQNGFDWAYPKGWHYYWKSLYLNGLEGDALEAFIQAGRERPTHESSVSLWALGGMPSRVPATATAFGKRDAPFLMTIETTWTDAADNERCTAWSREKWAAMRQFSDGGLYLNFAGFGEEKEALVRAGYGDNYDRLAALKARYDPGNLFRMNQNIKPA